MQQTQQRCQSGKKRGWCSRVASQAGSYRDASQGAINSSYAWLQLTLPASGVFEIERLPTIATWSPMCMSSYMVACTKMERHARACWLCVALWHKVCSYTASAAACLNDGARAVGIVT